MILFISFTTIIHGLLFAWDEYIIHKERTLSQKEVNAGLVTGVLFLVPVALTLFTTHNNVFAIIFILLGVLSCIGIIYLEFIYPERISRKERIIHAILYILHPLILYAFYLSWQQNFFTINLTYWMLQLGYFALGFKAITYHVIYWNYIFDPSEGKRKSIKVKDL